MKSVGDAPTHKHSVKIKRGYVTLGHLSLRPTNTLCIKVLKAIIAGTETIDDFRRNTGHYEEMTELEKQ